MQPAICITAPLSLCDPVGLRSSRLRYRRSIPAQAASVTSSRRGVLPSPRVSSPRSIRMRLWMYAPTNILDRWLAALPVAHPPRSPIWHSAKSFRAPVAAATSRSSARTPSPLRSTNRRRSSLRRLRISRPVGNPVGNTGGLTNGGVADGGLPHQLPEAGVLVGADVIAGEEARAGRGQEYGFARLRHLQGASHRLREVLRRFDLHAMAQQGGDQPVTPGSG